MKLLKDLRPNVLATHLLSWWDEGHADLPWRQSRDPYRIWISEIMLQQTQIKTVIPYYQRWLERFPTVEALAAAPLDDVLKCWEGLGYYSRARNLHTAAQTVATEHGGQLPSTAKALLGLKGIGRYTAGAIASIAFDQQVAVLDGNVIRVLSRLIDLPDDTTLTQTKNALWTLAESLVPAERPGDYNQAVMELGQRVCQPARPQCHICPVAALCAARQNGTQLERPVRPPRKNTPHYNVAAVVVYRSDGRFLITRRPLNGLLGGLWEFPGGKQEAEETLTETAAREIKEEVGLVIRVGRQITTVKHAYTHFRITLHTFAAEWVANEVEHLGVIDHAWVTLDDLEPYAFAVTDRKIIAALQNQTAGSQLALL